MRIERYGYDRFRVYFPIAEDFWIILRFDFVVVSVEKGSSYAFFCDDKID